MVIALSGLIHRAQPGIARLEIVQLVIVRKGTGLKGTGLLNAHAQPMVTATVRHARPVQQGSVIADQDQTVAQELQVALEIGAQGLQVAGLATAGQGLLELLVDLVIVDRVQVAPLEDSEIVLQGLQAQRGSFRAALGRPVVEALAQHALALAVTPLLVLLKPWFQKTVDPRLLQSHPARAASWTWMVRSAVAPKVDRLLPKPNARRVPGMARIAVV